MEMYMSRCEESTCKVLGLILFLLIDMTWLQISGCTCPPPPDPEYIDDVEVENLL